jgi:hypothetical protein
MAQGSDQIKHHIDQERQRLGSNIREIESRVKRSTDWKVIFDKNPWLVIGAAAAGGLVLSSLIGGGNSHSSETSRGGEEGARFASRHMEKVSETLDNIVGALIGLGTSKVRGFIADTVPGFADQYREAENNK